MLWWHGDASKDQQFDRSLQPDCCLPAKKAWWAGAGSNLRRWDLPWGSVTNRQREGRAKSDKPAAISCIAWQCFLFNLRGSANWKISSGRDGCQALPSPADDALAAAAAQDLAAQEAAAALRREHLSFSGVLKQVSLHWDIIWSLSSCWSWGIIAAGWNALFFTLAFRELLLCSCCSGDGLDTGLVWTTAVSIYKLALELVFQSEMINSQQEKLHKLHYMGGWAQWS